MAKLTLDHLLPASSSRLPANTYTYIGIDFGTSTTVVSLVEWSGKNVSATPMQIPQKDQRGAVVRDYKIPTCIAYSKKFDELYVGAGAYEARFDPRLELGKNVWFEFKTLLGEDVGPRYATSVLDGKEGRSKLETALDATAIFLEQVRTEVEKEIQARGLSANIMWSVSVPASFEANQRKDLISALDKAGIKNIGESMLIDEPNAAFLSYVEQSSRIQGQNPLVVPDGKPISVLVFDFGAGTCDISILQLQQDDFSGVRSKNVAISHYTEIGGKDIDRMIANKLLDQLVPFEEATPPVTEISSRVKERLSNQLLRIAEQLKVELCKQVMFHKGNGNEDLLRQLSSMVGLSPEVKDHQNRVYQLRQVKLTYEEMTEIINQFVDEGENKSVFIPIKSALRSAGLKQRDVDYVLFVGGSSKNPWIQTAVKKHFPESDYLFPDDMQTLVSQGAAIHSYYFNGLKHKLIKPITGPTIQLRMADGVMRVLVPSGTEIPYDGGEINDLRPQRDDQEAIELPVCLTSESHILQNLKIEPKEKTAFSISDKVSLSVKITADKTLHIAAKVSSGEAVVTQLNPYSSRALSSRERIAAEGRKNFNKDVRKNGGNPSAIALRTLAWSLEKAEQRKEAAETMEEAYNIDNTVIIPNNLGVMWANAGNSKKACEYYRKAADKNDVYACVNLATNLQWNNPIEYRQLLDRAYSLQPNNDWVLLNYGRMLKNEGNAEWKKHWTNCLSIYMDRFNSKTLSKDDAVRALEVARALEMLNEGKRLQNYIDGMPDNEQLFNDRNTVTSSKLELGQTKSFKQLNN